MIRKLLCLLGIHQWEYKSTTVFLDTDMMNVCKFCGKYQNPIVLQRKYKI